MDTVPLRLISLLVSLVSHMILSQEEGMSGHQAEAPMELQLGRFPLSEESLLKLYYSRAQSPS